MVWAWMLWSPYALGTRTEVWFGHGCSGEPARSEHEPYYGLGMDALVSVCTRNMNVIMVWPWMIWLPYALGTRTELWFGHGCSGHWKLLETARNKKPGFLSWSQHGWSAKCAMRGGSSDFEASEGPKVLFVPRRPAPMGSAFFARLRNVGAPNKQPT